MPASLCPDMVWRVRAERRTRSEARERAIRAVMCGFPAGVDFRNGNLAECLTTPRPVPSSQGRLSSFSPVWRAFCRGACAACGLPGFHLPDGKRLWRARTGEASPCWELPAASDRAILFWDRTAEPHIRGAFRPPDMCCASAKRRFREERRAEETHGRPRACANGVADGGMRPEAGARVKNLATGRYFDLRSISANRAAAPRVHAGGTRENPTGERKERSL